MTSHPGDCAECGKPLTSYEIKHGWITVTTGWRTPPARVHTICRRRFTERPIAHQKERAERQRA